MKYRIGKMCMALGIVLLVGAVALFLWNQKANQKAVEISRSVLEEMRESACGEDIHEEGILIDGAGSADMPEMIIDGYSYIGYVTLPSLGLQLPVMSELDFSRLKVAPCRYFGSTQTDDLVIAGHNYRGHFGNLKNMKIDEEVWFTDVAGACTIYIVEEVQILEGNAIEEMTSGAYDLSLFTCTYGGESRLSVRCMRK